MTDEPRISPSVAGTERPRRYIVAFATGWGSRFGGINVLNTTLLQNLAVASKNLRILCVLPGSDVVDLSIPPGNVDFVFLEMGSSNGRFREDAAAVAVELAKENGLRSDSDVVWLGHDLVTGPLAVAAKATFGGRAAVIHHMSYQHYEQYAEDALLANEKTEAQKAIFRQADIRFAIGPLLRDALADLVAEVDVRMLVPGIDDVSVMAAPRTFTAFLSGRIGPGTSKIKQAHLGVAAFATAFKKAANDRTLPDQLRDQPMMKLRGVDLDSTLLEGQPDLQYWARFAQEYADRVVTIHALPFSTEHGVVLKEVAGASVALMPSWHEGFGLSGWEAIGAGVPLVLTKNSGLFRLLDETSHSSWVNWVYSVDIRGKLESPFFHDEDLRVVTEQIVHVARDPAAARQKAALLRLAALERFSWAHCVEEFFDALAWAFHPTRVETAPPAAIATVTHANSSDAIPLFIPPSIWSVDRGLAYSQLLRAEEEAVPFDAGRNPELSELHQWAGSEFPDSLRLVTGAGGSGKTRLSLQLMRELASDGWLCGFVPSDLSDAQTGNFWPVLFKSDQPLLVVIDYAETRETLLVSLLRSLIQQRSEHKPVRILLLARRAGEWWDRLPEIDPACEAFLTGNATSGPFHLRSLHDSIVRRQAAFGAAVTAYSSRIGIDEPAQFEVDLSGEHFGYPLYIQIAALLALYGERPASAEALTRALLNHERRYWKRSIEAASDRNLSSVSVKQIEELVGLATLAGGFTWPTDASAIWRQWNASEGKSLPSASIKAAFTRVASLYSDKGRLDPLRPDILGEALVADALLRPSGAGILDVFLSARTTRARRRTALSVLARASNNRIDIETTFVRSLTRHFNDCILDLVNVASHGDSRLPEWSETAFRNLSASEMARAINILRPQFEHESVELAGLACVVAEAEVAKEKAHLSKNSADARLRANYAVSLSNYAIDLHRAGRQPLFVAEESVKILRELIEEFPDRFDTQYANALNTYANALGDQGFDEAAMDCCKETLTIVERLAPTQGDEGQSALAQAMHNYAVRLRAFAQFDQALLYAERALAIRKGLPKHNVNYRSDLADSLANYSEQLAVNARYSESLETAKQSLDTYQELTLETPDRFTPALAGAMNVYSIRLSENGRLEESLEFAAKSVEMRQKLAAKNPPRFEARYEDSLNTLGNRLSEKGDFVGALASSAAALTIAERRARDNPQRDSRGLALVLRSMGIRRAETGDYEGAINDVERAIEIYRQLRIEHPGKFDPDLAGLLHNYSSHLADVGDYSLGAASSEEAIAIFGPLVANGRRIMAIDLHLAELGGCWLRWIGDSHSEPGFAAINAPNDDLYPPHRIRTSKLFEAWLRACVDPISRESAVADVLRIAADIHEGERRLTQGYWLCACAWAASHSPSLLSSYDAEWRIGLREYERQRSGRLPTWMTDTSVRLAFSLF